MSYFNHVLISEGGTEWLSEAQLAVNSWNLIEIAFGNPLEIRVNSISEARQSTGQLILKATELSRNIELGSLEYRGLMKMPIVIQGISFKPSMQFPPYIDKHALQPIRSLEELSLWKPEFDQHNKIRTKYISKPREGKEVLACHDMCHNYKEDNKTHKKAFCYRYLHFDRTHYFCYFSHSRVTIPPPGWSEVCHMHSCKSLGTFITEWEEGVLENDRLLERPEFYADKLIDLMLYYGFEGWLLNFEADVKNPQLLMQWVSYLTARAKERAGPNATIVWYDSVTHSGNVRWQSCLNHENSEFFMRSDLFFTDYHWREGMPLQSASLAGDRNWDVLTGVDVYGRGTFGGGQYNTRAAIEAMAPTSVAIFAPGWTYENKSNYNRDQFWEAEKLMWSSTLVPLIDTYGVILPDRPKSAPEQALQNWTVEIFNGNWVIPQDKAEAIQLTTKDPGPEGFSLVTGHMFTRRSTKVDISKLQNIDKIIGETCLKGTWPKFEDDYILTLEILDGTGQVLRSATTGQRKATESWETVRLEIPASGGKFVRWCEAGKDTEFWAGFYGVRFGSTNVFAQFNSKTLHQQLPLSKVSRPIQTWFNEGQGSKLMSQGVCIYSNGYNSLRDADVLPNFELLLDGGLNNVEVFHGCSSLRLKDYTGLLFATDFEVSEKYLKFIYKGTGTLDIVLISQSGEPIFPKDVNASIENSWTVIIWTFADSFLLDSILVEAVGTVFLGGLHFIPVSKPNVAIENLSISLSWSKLSLTTDDNLTCVDLTWNTLGSLEEIRHFDIYLDSSWVGRAYGNRWHHKGLKVREQLSFQVVAESWWGSRLTGEAMQGHSSGIGIR